VGDFDLTGRVAVVTAAGSGIGEGIARAFADAGAAVVLAGSSAAEVECVASSIRHGGARAIAVGADVTDAFALGSLATAAVDEFGHLDLWVNNAGGVELNSRLADLKRSEWDQIIDLNFTAVWNGAMAAVEQMQWGSIINVLSGASSGVGSGVGHHAACRAAVTSMTRTMAIELAPDIRVNAIAPGMIPTEPLFADAGGERPDLDDLATSVPLGSGTPADIAATAVYLASPAARWVTGQTIQVSGGMTIV
jgi:7-alpha-hydroxysteroid dehydrogenase